MLVFSIALAGLIGMVACVQIVSVARYLSRFSNEMVPVVNEAELPSAAVIVSLRGADPFLHECLDRLATQDYPCFEVHVVVDHPTDPACKAVQAWLAMHLDRNFYLSFLEERSETAYLKASAIRQCAAALAPSIEVALLVDADTLVYRRWLRDMVAPLRETGVGAVTGNRWYDPNLCRWGSLVRYLYNVACIIPMDLMHATWAGSLSMRREVFATEYFSQRMFCTPSDEAAVQDATREANLQVVRNPDVMILNREECTLGGCFRFIRRQLIWTRLYHSTWLCVVLGTVSLYFIFSLAFVLATIATLSGGTLVGAILGGTLAGEMLISLLLVEWMHAAVARRALAAQGSSFPPISWAGRLRLLVAMPVALVVIAWAVIGATVSRRVRWRGIEYEIVPPDAIRLVQYRPYADVVQAEAEGLSLS